MVRFLISAPDGAEHKKGQRPERPSIEQRAQRQADVMRTELGLTDRQYKKVYKLVKKDLKYDGAK